jgi:hypothetical protein
LIRLFDAAAKGHPEIAAARPAVEELDRLRTTRITRAVTEWPVDLKQVPGILLD